MFVILKQLTQHEKIYSMDIIDLIPVFYSQKMLSRKSCENGPFPSNEEVKCCQVLFGLIPVDKYK